MSVQQLKLRSTRVRMLPQAILSRRVCCCCDCCYFCDLTLRHHRLLGCCGCALKVMMYSRQCDCCWLFRRSIRLRTQPGERRPGWRPSGERYGAQPRQPDIDEKVLSSKKYSVRARQLHRDFLQLSRNDTRRIAWMSRDAGRVRRCPDRELAGSSTWAKGKQNNMKRRREHLNHQLI